MVSCNSLTHILSVLYSHLSYNTSEFLTAVNINYQLLDMTPYSLVDMLYLLRRSSRRSLHMYTNPRVTRGVYRSPTRCACFASSIGHGRKINGYPLHIFLELLRSLSSAATYIPFIQLFILLIRIQVMQFGNVKRFGLIDGCPIGLDERKF